MVGSKGSVDSFLSWNAQTMGEFGGAQRKGGGPVDKFPGFMSELVSRNVGVAAIQETRWLGSGEKFGRILSLNRHSPVSFLVIAL